MSRFLVFRGEDYYPSGGWKDLVGRFETLDEALAEAQQVGDGYSGDDDWSQVVDLDEGIVIAEFPTEEQKQAYFRDLNRPGARDARFLYSMAEIPFEWEVSDPS